MYGENNYADTYNPQMPERTKLKPEQERLMQLSEEVGTYKGQLSEMHRELESVRDDLQRERRDNRQLTAEKSSLSERLEAAEARE